MVSSGKVVRVKELENIFNTTPININNDNNNTVKKNEQNIELIGRTITTTTVGDDNDNDDNSNAMNEEDCMSESESIQGTQGEEEFVSYTATATATTTTTTTTTEDNNNNNNNNNNNSENGEEEVVVVSIRVLGKLMKYDANEQIGILKDDEHSLIFDSSYMTTAFKWKMNNLYFLIGEYELNSSYSNNIPRKNDYGDDNVLNNGVLKVRVAQNAEGLNVKAYHKAAELRKEFLANFGY
jgi:hypothetical protein